MTTTTDAKIQGKAPGTTPPENVGPKAGMGISPLNKSGSGTGQGDNQGPKTGMGISPPNKSGSGTGQGDNQGPKTGMGIDVHQAHALLIGIGDCKYTEWSLPVTALDVDALAKILVDPGIAAYPVSNITKLQHDKATRQGILDALAGLAERAAGEEDATFLVYYSGHGWRDETTGRYFLIPHDVRPHDIPGSALAAEEFMAALRRIRTRRVLVMIDTCHASGMADAKDLVATEVIPKGWSVTPVPESLLGQGEGRAVFLSCLDREKSWILPGNNSLSVFTHHLIDGLDSAGSGIDAKGTHTVTVSDLMGYLSAKVPASAAELGRVQTPFFKFETIDFAIALHRGGKGLAAPLPSPTPAQSSPTVQMNIGTIQAGRNVTAIANADQVHINNGD